MTRLIERGVLDKEGGGDNKKNINDRVIVLAAWKIVKSMLVACWLQGQTEQPKTESANPNKAALQLRHKSNHLHTYAKGRLFSCCICTSISCILILLI